MFPSGTNIFGVTRGEVPPVPIPNTEVKLTIAEDTRLETVRENKSMPKLIVQPNRVTYMKADRTSRLYLLFYFTLKIIKLNYQKRG